MANMILTSSIRVAKMVLISNTLMATPVQCGYVGMHSQITQSARSYVFDLFSMLIVTISMLMR